MPAPQAKARAACSCAVSCAAVAAMLLWAAAPGFAAEAATHPATGPWDVEALYKTPKTWPAEGFKSDGVQALFYEGEPFKGKPTRVFAWVGLPQAKAGAKVPGIVLTHGGAGTAWSKWVRLWTARGYAAIAMDNCAHVPTPDGGGIGPRHEWSGPDGWGGFGQIDWPVKDQWTYHAVAAVIRAHSLLRSYPQVDADRIGTTGISWGGWLTSIVAPLDTRLKFAIPIYGCGFLQDDSFLVGNFRQMGPVKAKAWQALWEPSAYLPAMRAGLPVLWMAGTNDFAYPLSCLQKSYRATPAHETLSIRIRMPHGYEPGWGPAEIGVFADSVVRGGVPLAEVTAQGRDGARAWVAYRAKSKIERAELCYTKEVGVWQKRLWQSAPAELDVAANKAAATIPAGTRVYFLNLIDDRNLVVSGEHEELPAADPATAPAARG
jgi:cephalosporin-C deacetylase-like acetyl esterase